MERDNQQDNNRINKQGNKNPNTTKPQKTGANKENDKRSSNR